MSQLDRRTLLVSSALALIGSTFTAAALTGSGGKARSSGPPEVKTGGVKTIPVRGGKYNVWTKRIGRGPIKVLTLHGGPGIGHEYFECFEDFLPQAGIELYYYDQLGCSYSDQPDDASLWTIDGFRDEVEDVRKGLGLDSFYLYGQSWGSMLGIEYALKYQQHLKALVLSDMTASIPSYVSYMAELRKQLPAEVNAILEKYEAKKDFEAQEYQDTLFGKVYSKHLCRLDPWPEPVLRALKHMNNKVYNTLQGPNEFVITGTMKDWDRWKDLPAIKTPTLVIGARHDTMSPADLEREAKLIPNSRLHICPNGSHLCLWDDQQDYMKALLGFLMDVQSGTFGVTPRRPATGRA